jgi:hypothetical protein
MRDLDFNELQFVSGANRSPAPPTAGNNCSPCPPTSTRSKNNNGYGNDAESGQAPGSSGSSNPQLTTQNSGPRGAR